MDPEAIHELGLKKSPASKARNSAIARKLGFSDLKSFRASRELRIPNLFLHRGRKFSTSTAITSAKCSPNFPQLFGLLPKTRLEIRPVQQYREKDAPAWQSITRALPTARGPGIVYVNTGDYAHRSLLEIEATAYHEAIPGHHMQISIAQTLARACPLFASRADTTPTSKAGRSMPNVWGKMSVFIRTPIPTYGRLADEMLRAVRLVVDTGVHYKHWTRQQMVDYFHAAFLTRTSPMCRRKLTAIS